MYLPTPIPHRLTRPLAAVLAACLFPGISGAAERLPRELEGVDIQERLGSFIDKSLEFQDHTGATVTLENYFQDGKPVLLTLNYYRCKMLCTLQLNAVARGLKELGWVPGHEYRMVTVSIDSRETPQLAAEKRVAYLAALGMGAADWSFLTGTSANIETLAQSLGFTYRYDPAQDQFAHTAAIYLLTPAGAISRYLYGLEYKARDLRFAIMDASQGKAGSTLDKVILSCFHYDAALGNYSAFAFGIMRLGGMLTLALVAAMLIYFWRREHAPVPLEDVS